MALRFEPTKIPSHHPYDRSARSDATYHSKAEKEVTSAEVNELYSLSRKSTAEVNLIPLEQVLPVFKASRAFVLAFLSICLITLAAALDATSLSIALPIITEKLQGSAIEAFWSGTSFLVTSAVFQPVIAGLSHVFGRKHLLLASAVFFAVGSLIAAIATNFTVMLVGRSIQGIGGGGVLTLGEILVTDLVPLSARGTWFGWLSSIWALGSVSGPLMGAAFAQKVSWRWIFWINLPIIGLGSIAIYIWLILDRLPGSFVSKLRSFDWLGSIFFIASTVSLLIPMSWGGVMYPWSHWRTLVPLIVGTFGIFGSGYYEYWLSRKAIDENGDPLPGQHVDPIIRFSIFSNATLIITYVETIIHGMVLWSLLYYLPLYYEGVKGYTPIISGVAVLPETSFVTPMSIIVGITCAVTGRYRWAIWTGWVFTTVGAGLLIFLDPHTTVPAWVFLNVPIAIGTGMLFPAMALCIQAAGRPQDAGHNAAFYSFTRVFGQSFGVAVGGVIFQNQIKANLLAYPLLAPMATAYSKDATSLVKIIAEMEEGLGKSQLVQAYADSLKMIWLVMCMLSALAMMASYWTKGYSLEQEHSTTQGFGGDVVMKDPENGDVKL